MAIDTTKPTGSGGFLLIRDYVERSDGLVEFYIKSGSSQTYDPAVSCSWTTPSGNGSKVVNYPSGAPLLYVGGIKVTKNGTVTFSMADTETIGLGGPTSMSRVVSRTSAPPAPSQNNFSLVTHTSARMVAVSNGNGGSAITGWETAFGTNSAGPDASGNSKYSSSGTVDFNNLQPGVKYYAWTRNKNALGWSGWSARKDLTTLQGIKMKVSGVWKNAVPYVKVAGVWKPAIPYYKNANTWKTTVG